MFRLPRWSTYGLTFLGGAALGAAGCLLWSRKRVKREIEARVEHEVSAMKEYYEHKEDVVLEPLPVKDEEDSVVEPQEEPKSAAQPSIFVRPNTEAVSYNRQYILPDIEKKPDLLEATPDDWPEGETEEEFDQRDQDYDDDPEIREARDMENHKEPYLIDGSSYLGEYPQYDKVEMTYWAGDDTLTMEGQEDSELVDDEHYWLGPIIDQLRSGEIQETVYVRNHSMAADIEVDYKTGMYSLASFGIDGELLEDLESITDEGVRRQPRREESDDE